jgi:hypothetical protein
MESHNKPFLRYIINAPHTDWWEKFGEPFLNKKNWRILEPSNFSFKSSYGFDHTVSRPLLGKQIPDEDYCLENAAIVIEFHGDPVYDSVFNPARESTIIDDLLLFMSVYSGKYCHYLWKETRKPGGQWSASKALMMGDRGFGEPWPKPPDKAIDYFKRALSVIPTVDQTRLRLAIQWFFTALREFEIGRPLVEAALNWVCLETQANFLGLSGSKKQKVEALLKGQQFPSIPLLGNFYKLRNDAFHEGQLSNLAETDAQAARTAGRILVRASTLVLLGMRHADFYAGFVASYA